jgi:hypothetical protein
MPAVGIVGVVVTVPLVTVGDARVPVGEGVAVTVPVPGLAGSVRVTVTDTVAFVEVAVGSVGVLLAVPPGMGGVVDAVGLRVTVDVIGVWDTVAVVTVPVAAAARLTGWPSEEETSTASRGTRPTSRIPSPSGGCDGRCGWPGPMVLSPR